MNLLHFLPVAEDLELAGLLWKPEIGDEVADRDKRESISVFVDPQGLTPEQLRGAYLWLPTVEQMVEQLEARQAILFHAGLELSTRSLCYKTVIQSPVGHIETRAESLRISVGIALRDLLLSAGSVH
ncbi:MAG: hypothetical protein J5J00_13770 [Deltaproteobacteria bacterium]|nr:hypothetical protein [Deltaproteobacteria bacterium]